MTKSEAAIDGDALIRRFRVSTVQLEAQAFLNLVRLISLLVFKRIHKCSYAFCMSANQ